MTSRISDGSSDLSRWRTFLAVHTAGSFSAAARALGISQPAVTAHVQALERALGEPLFVRLPRGVEATPRADELATLLSGPFEAVAEAVVGATGMGPARQPPVRLGGAGELLAEVVVPALAPLVADGVRVQVVPGLSGELVEALRTGLLDFVVAAERPRGRSLVASPLTDETFALVAAPALAARQGLTPSRVVQDGPSALDGVPLLAYAPDVPIVRRYWRHVFGRRLEREPELTFPDLRAVRAAASAGAGVTVLPTYLCRDELDAGRLVLLLHPDDPPINTLYLARHPGGSTRPHVDRVSAAVAAAVQDTV